jgi:Fe-Mn family superoxide dismutase
MQGDTQMKIQDPMLPYDMDALEPYMSEKTLSYHFGKHHHAYVNKLRKLVEGTDYENLDIEEIIAKARKEGNVAVFNNAAQAWNHDFFWKSLAPTGGKPGGQVKELVESAFGSIEDFKSKFAAAATGLFGSGWVWLVIDQGKVKISSGSNADTPVGTSAVPLLTLDVWEHAYYLDYQNERGKFVDAFLDKLINWNFADSNLNAQSGSRAA